MKSLFAALGAAALLGGTAMPASAFLFWDDSRYVAELGQGEPYVDEYGRFCQRRCPDDYAPCDPPHWKSADARCGFLHHDD
jgi:hypothetical protein